MKALLEREGMYDVEVDSAGIGNWHAGELPDHRMRKCGARRGYDFNSRARQIRPEDFDRFDLVLGMDEENRFDLMQRARNDDDRRKIGMLVSYVTRHPEARTIPDPYYGGERDFEYALDLIEDACEGLLMELKKSE